MTIRTFILAALVIGYPIGSALADERINLTPPLYREQARATATIRAASELTTTPRLAPTAELSQRDPEVTGSLAR